ncbi:MAG TPA: hypothetical protein VMM18_06935 [Gemmatimonadaceae bacterium]|nr:hypothetical protein [Gemmatimonadaceae bacterium]
MDAVKSLIGGIGRSITSERGGAAQLAHDAWRLGALRHASGSSLHQLACEVELLEAMLLHLAERAADHEADRAAAGVRAARTLHRSMSLIKRAALKGFTHAYVERQREHLRTLRHDLRNPLGTIRNAISFYDDRAIPASRRDPARLRSMVDRNLARVDEMIERHLADRTIMEGELGRQQVELRELVFAVRRTLREASATPGTEIEADASLPTVLADSTAVELVLFATLACMLESGSGARLVIEAAEVGDHALRLHVTPSVPAAAEIAELEMARLLARLAGGDVTVARSIVVDVPVSPRQTRDNVVRTSERNHRQP